MSENLVIYARNVREFYPALSWLRKCVEKRINKGEAVDINYLARCSTMTSLVSSVAKYGAKFGETYTKEDKRQACMELAEYIIEDTKI